MYILIELLPEAGGSGFGIFFCVLLGLAFLFIMAQYAMTWLLAPAAIVMTLLQNETLWWILPTLFVVGALVNWILAKLMDNVWCPSMSLLLTLVVMTIALVVGLIIDPLKGEQLWLLLLLPIVLPFIIILLAIVYYPMLNMVMAASSITTLPCGYKPCLGAIAFVCWHGGRRAVHSGHDGGCCRLVW